MSDRSIREQAKTLIRQLLEEGGEAAPIGMPSQGLSQNVNMTTANKEYEVSFPAGTKKFSVRMRSTSYAWRFSYQKGRVATSSDPYSTVPAAGEYYEEDLLIAFGQKLYVACSTAAQVLECTFWV